MVLKLIVDFSFRKNRYFCVPAEFCISRKLLDLLRKYYWLFDTLS